MKKVCAWLLCAAWMGVIFVMSAMPGDVSGEQSGRVVRLLLSALHFVFGGESPLPPQTLSLLVRKAAHMAEYAILFLLYRRALALSGARYPGVAALVMSACYAVTDEWHQSFVDGRGPSAVDVLIDTLGAGCAWGAASILKRTDRAEKMKS